MYDYVIVGAGLFGSIFAHEATKKNKKCLVIEKRSHVGGNLYTKEVKGITMHMYGPHIFHTSNKKIWDYICQFGTFNNFLNTPVAVYGNEVYNLPFNMNTFTKLWGAISPNEAKMKIEADRILNPKNLEEKAISLVGVEIYEKLIKGYTEKQWGKKATELPSDIIKRLPVRFTYNNNYFNDTYQGIPAKGYTSIVEAMLEGCDVCLDTDYFEDRTFYQGLGKTLLYTGMLDKFYEYKYGELAYRSLEFQHETLNEDNHQGNAVVNYTSADIPYTRIIEHKHFNYEQSSQTIITKEYPCKWNQGVEPFYPVNDLLNQDKYNMYKELACNEDSILFGGRLAEYKYYNMDAIVEKALVFSRDIK